MSRRDSIAICHVRHMIYRTIELSLRDTWHIVATIADSTVLKVHIATIAHIHTMHSI